MLSAAVTALIATLALAAPALLVLILALTALFPRPSPASAMSTAAPQHPTSPADTSVPVRVEQQKGGWKEGDRKEEPSGGKERKEYAKERRTSGGGQRETESPTPAEYRAQHTGLATEAGAKAETGAKAEAEASKREKKAVDSEELAPAVYETADTFYTVLCLKKADNFAIMGRPEETPIWVCTKKDRVVDVLKGLIERNILSVPVLLDNGKWYGFLDMMDIVRYIVKHFGPAALGEQQSFWKLVQEENKFEQKTVEDLMQWPASPRQAFVPVISGYSAYAVMETMAREKGLRRVPVLNDRAEKKLLNLVTQSQCVRWLAKHMDLLGAKKKKPVALCPHFFKEVVSVKEDDMALAAFELMVDKNIQGLAVLDKDGRLVGNLSIRDLKLIGHEANMFWRLQQTVKNFLVKVRKEYSEKHSGTRHRHAIYVLPKATMRDVITVLNEHDIHRVYVCNNHVDKRPMGVISLRDVLLECIGV